MNTNMQSDLNPIGPEPNFLRDSVVIITFLFLKYRLKTLDGIERFRNRELRILESELLIIISFLSYD